MQNKSEVIRKQAEVLMVGNGSATTLEIKNAIHASFPGCGLTQAEVSAEMLAYESEKPTEITSRLESNPVPHKVYSLVSVPVAAPVATSTDLVSAAISAVNADKARRNTVTATSVLAAGAQGGNNVIVGKIDLYDEAFLSKLDKKIYIAYSVNKAPVLTSEKNKYDARRLFKTITGEKHNEVRMMTLKRYLSVLKKQKQTVGFNPAN